MRHRVISCGRWLSAAVLVLATGIAGAQGYPAKPIRLIVPYGPGGGTDVAARIASHFLGERLGVQVVVENRVGGSGAVGLEAAARAVPDGYTLLFSGPDAISTLPLLRKNLPIDTLKDFVPIAQVGTADFVFAVHPKVPVHTIEELIALAKSKPGGLRYSSAGTGTTLHVMGEMLKYRTGIDLVHVPYKSGGQATIDTVAGHVEMISTAVSVIIKQIQADQLRPLAVSSAERSSLLPAVPTMAERGFPNFIATSWFGVFGPKGLPEPVIKRLSDEIKAAASSAEFRQRASAIGIGGAVLLREDFAKYIATELGRWREVIEVAKINVDEQ
ncbi:MAG: Bug family tripartite tricarboxylate transporter substrate binding protein [Burkholderiales bacterium]